MALRKDKNTVKRRPTKYRSPRIYLYALALLLALAACSRRENAGNETTPAATRATPAATARPTATERPAAPTTTPTPNRPAPAVSAGEQAVGSDGQVVVDQVVAPEAAWLVIRADEDGEPGAVLGYAAVAEGENEDVAVTVDPHQVTPTLYAALHQDAGRPGDFEFPGPDTPWPVEADAAVAFEVEVEVAVPAVMVSDQDVTEEGIVVVNSVTSDGPGWLALLLDEAGTPGRMVAYAPVRDGLNENVALAINWRVATPILHAALYQDTGEPEQFEFPEADPMAMVNDQPVISSFQVFLPPDVFVLDQPVVDGTVIVERVISYGPGWLVVYYDEGGAAGRIIGWAPLVDGLNEQIVVPVVESAVTELLHIIIHQDTEAIGEFEFPQADPPLRYDGRIPNPFTFRTDAGNYLITRDQPLSVSNTVTVSLAVVNVNAWVVIYNDAAGEPGEVIGTVWIPAGVNREIVVAIDPEQTTPVLHVVLHQDVGAAQEFELEGGVDLPLQRNRSVITAPLTLLRQ